MDTLRRRQMPAGHVLEVRNLKISRAYRVEEGVNSGSACIPISCRKGPVPGIATVPSDLLPIAAWR